MITAMTIEEIASAVKGRILGNTRDAVQGVSTDTRSIQQGDLYVPIKGERFDGHDFLMQAFEKGAVCALSEREVQPPEGKTIIYVEDTRSAYRDLAEYYLSIHRVFVVGVTGSVGKTTTKDLIASVLKEKFQVLATKGNLNNEIGLPSMVFQLKEDTQVAVLEMGMNHFGEIHRLAKVARPDMAVITNVGVSHIENLGSREGILKAKSEIFDYFQEDAQAVLNADDDMLKTLAGKVTAVWFGVEEKKDFWADEIVPLGLEGMKCRIHTPKGSFSVTIPVPGVHMVSNAMAAAAVGLKLGMSLSEIERGIASFVPTAMRMMVTKTASGINLINDCYNANPVSMKASIDVLKEAKSRKVAVLGDMYELGEDGKKMHWDVGKYAAQNGVDLLICLGELSEAMAEGAKENGCPQVKYYKTQTQWLEEGLPVLIQPGDTVLVKASRGMGLEKTAEKIGGVR